MKKLRRRLTLLFFLLVAFSSVFSIIISWMIRTRNLLGWMNIRYIIFGFAAKDLFLLICAIFIGGLLIFIFSKRTASPIAELSRAATQIASGDFNVCVEESDRKDEIGELQKQFNRMIRELQSNEYLKKDFISSVSHEFKTPLAIIRGYAQLLGEDALAPGERRHYAALIMEESSRLSRLTSNILRLSQLNQDTFLLRHTAFSLDEQLRQSLLLLEPKWSAGRISFQLDLPETVCCGDDQLLSEVWMNLLDNAIKFSLPGGRIFVSLKHKTAGGFMVRIRDEGLGMDAATQERIFEQFYQGDTSHKQEGSGLGLSIAVRIVALHCGKIEVESRPGQGSCFTVTLPQ